MRFHGNNSWIETDEVQVPFIPMADLMFNLLIFFILTSIFAVLETQIGIELPSATSSVSAPRTPTTIIINVDNKGHLRVNERDFTLEQLEGTLKRLSELGGTSVIIRGDRNTKWERIVQIMDACSRVDIKDVNFATLKERPAGNRNRASEEAAP